MWIGPGIIGGSFVLGVIGVLLFHKHSALGRTVVVAGAVGIFIGMLVEFALNVRF